MARRGDNIPPVSAYAHWNEDAERMWYEENKYDMEHWDEPIDDDEEGRGNRYYPEDEDDKETDEVASSELADNQDKAAEQDYRGVVPNGGPCPGCGRIMSLREKTEQGACNDDYSGSDPGEGPS